MTISRKAAHDAEFLWRPIVCDAPASNPSVEKVDKMIAQLQSRLALDFVEVLYEGLAGSDEDADVVGVVSDRR